MAQYVALRGIRSARVRVPAVTPLGTPSNVAVAAVGTGGTFAAATYYWKISAINTSGESIASAEVNKAIVLNGSANLTWNAVSGAASYHIYRGTATGAEDHYQTSSTNSFTDTGAAGTAGTPRTVATGVNAANAELSDTTDTIVDLDLATVRQALSHHRAIGQFYVTAANNTYGATGSKSALSSNS